MSRLHAAVVALIAAAYGEAFLGYARLDWREWALGGAYTHAWLALPVFVWLLWRASRRAGVFLPRLSGHLPGYLVLVAGVALKVHGELAGYNVLRGMSIVPVLLGTLMVLYSGATARAFLFPVLFLLFIVPLPNFVIDEVTLPLRSLSTASVSSALAALGYAVRQSGFSLQLEAGDGVRELVVSDACSGIRSLVALSAIGALFLHLQPFGPWRKAALFTAVLPLAVAGNFVRILATALVAYHRGTAAAESFFHGASGVVTFVVALGGLFLLTTALRPRAIRP